MDIFTLLGYLLFMVAIGYYTITNLQWYGYKLERVLFHHTKSWWHLLYFVAPFVLYVGANYLGGHGYVVALIYLGLLYFWYRSLDKPLVFTGRVKRFYGLLMLAAVLCALAWGCYSVLIPLLAAILLSMGIEKMLFNGFKRQAEKRLQAMEDLRVIGITASYGKTSIKNFIAHLLQIKYRTYATPRSVNTLGGIMKDVNEDLPEDTEIYVVEMGARGEGDIAEIATFVNPHYVVVGKIGPAHIEYFKSMEKIRDTKMEILQTSRLEEAWIHESAHVKPESHIYIFGSDIQEIEATLEATGFTLNGVRYHASILGAFNAMNLAAAVKVAMALGLTEEEIQQGLSTLKPVDHRLQRIDAGGKVILDDSFNGNVDGMLASFDLATTYEGRKVVITPGLIEAEEALNKQVAIRANEVFDLVILTGDLNYALFREYINEDKLLHLSVKSEMEQMLATQTRSGDLILFANDAPSFV